MNVLCPRCKGTGVAPGTILGLWRKIRQVANPDACGMCQGDGYVPEEELPRLLPQVPRRRP